MKKGRQWLRRQQRDPYVQQAQKDNYRSRAVFKLKEIDQRDRLFKRGQIVVDLGSAPGSWSEYAVQKTRPGGRVIAVDILPMQAVEGVEFIQGDFAEKAVFEQCLHSLGKGKANLVISDISPNLTGIRDVDQARSLQLAGQVLDFAGRVLTPEGSLLLKVFQGVDIDSFRKLVNAVFQQVSSRKPGASRDSSREFYILARALKV